MVSDKRREDFEKAALYVQSGALGVLTACSVVPKVADETNKWLLGTTYPSFADHSVAVLSVGSGTLLAMAGARAEKKTRRDTLRVASGTYLLGSAQHWYHGFVSKQEKKAPAILMGTSLGLIGAAGLAAGFQKYGDDKKTETKKSTK